MTQFIELTGRHYDNRTNEYVVTGKFLMDFNSAWEIYDRGEEPTHWVNNKLGMNHGVKETYQEIKNKLIAAGMFVDLDVKVAP